MCNLLLLHEGGRAADEMLGTIGVPISKALRLGTPKEFEHAVAVLAAKLRRAAGKSDVEAVRAAAQVLDVDWRATTVDERRRLIDAALVAAGRATAIIPARIEVEFGRAAGSVIAAARSQARLEHGLAIRAELNALDRRVVDHITRSQTNFVRDEYGRRVDAFAEKARAVVAAGVEQGLGQRDIAMELESAARAALVERAPFYWEVVASAFVGQGRSLGHMSAFAEAGIERYMVSAILDSHTTDTCRYLNGKTFSVGHALDRFDRINRLQDPEDVKRELPWVRQNGSLLYADGVAGRVQIAEVTRSAFGTADDAGEFRTIATQAQLEDTVPGWPPYHAMCRSTVVPA